MKKIILVLLFTPVFSQSQICSPPSAYAELDIGNCRVGLLNSGDLWWDGIDKARYEIPKIDPSSGQTPLSVLFVGSIWLSARDNSNNLKTAAMTFSNSGNEFFAGPLSNNTGSTTFNICNIFDRFFEVRKSEIDIHQSLINAGLPIPISQISINILNWPAKGNTHFNGFIIEDDLAPFHDFNQNGIYDPENGDYPKTIGDQSFFWVINDEAGFHNLFGGDPLKVQINCLAHAFDDPLLQNTTMYEYEIINKSFGDLHDFYFGLFVDPDLGNSSDDYVGCDTMRNASFVYNENAVDLQYGTNPPIVSIPFLNQTMSSFGTFVNSGPLVSQGPTNDIELNNYLQGKYANGSPFCQNGLQGSANCIPSKFEFPGNPNEPGEISLCQSFTAGDDYRMIQSIGPLDLPAWEPVKIAWAAHVVFPTLYDGCPDVNTDFGNEVDLVISSYSILSQALENLPTRLRENQSVRNSIKLYPNPASNFLQIESAELNIESVQILSLEGKLIKEVKLNHTSPFISIEHLSEGLYLMSIQTEEEVVLKKFLKN